MEILITVLLTLSVTMNVVVFSILGLAYRQWKKGQKKSDDIDKLFQQWNGRNNS